MESPRTVRYPLPFLFASAAVVNIDVTGSATAGQFTLSAATYPDGLFLDNIGSTSVTLTSVVAHGEGLRVSSIAAGGAAPDVLIEDCTFTTSTAVGALLFASPTFEARTVTVRRTAITQSSAVPMHAAVRFVGGINGAGSAGRSGSTTEVEFTNCTIMTVSAATEGDPTSSGPALLGAYIQGAVTNVARLSIIDTNVSCSVAGGRGIGVLVSGGFKHMGRFELLRSSFSGISPKVPSGLYVDRGWLDMDAVLFQDSNFSAIGQRVASAFSTWSPNYAPEDLWSVDTVASFVSERCRYVATAATGSAIAAKFSSGVRSTATVRFSGNLYSAIAVTGATGLAVGDTVHHVGSFVFENCSVMAESSRGASGMLLEQVHDTTTLLIRGSAVVVKSDAASDTQPADGIRILKGGSIAPSEYGLRDVTSFTIEDTSIAVSGFNDVAGFVSIPLRDVAAFIVKNCSFAVKTTGGATASALFIDATRNPGDAVVTSAVEDVGVFKLVDTTMGVFAHHGESRGLNFNLRVRDTSLVVRGCTIHAETSGTGSYSGAVMARPGGLQRAPLVEVSDSALSSKCTSHCFGLHINGFKDFSTFIVRDSSLSAEANATTIAGYPAGYFLPHFYSVAAGALQPPSSEGTIESLSDPHFPPEHRFGTPTSGTSGSVVFLRSNFTGVGSERARGGYASNFRPRRFVARGCVFNATGPGRSLAFFVYEGVHDSSLLLFESSLFYARSWAVYQCGGVYVDHSWFDLGEVRFVRSTFDSAGPSGVTNVRLWTHLPPAVRNVKLLSFDGCDMTAIATTAGAGNLFITRGAENVDIEMVRSTLRVAGAVATRAAPVSNILWTFGMTAAGLSFYAFNSTFQILPQSTATLWAAFVTLPENVTRSNFTLDSVLIDDGASFDTKVFQHPGLGGVGLDLGGSVWISLHCAQRLFATRFSNGSVVLKDPHVDPIVRPLVLDVPSSCRFYDTLTATATSVTASWTSSDQTHTLGISPTRTRTPTAVISASKTLSWSSIPSLSVSIGTATGTPISTPSGSVSHTATFTATLEQSTTRSNTLQASHSETTSSSWSMSVAPSSSLSRSPSLLSSFTASSAKTASPSLTSTVARTASLAPPPSPSVSGVATVTNTLSTSPVVSSSRTVTGAATSSFTQTVTTTTFPSHSVGTGTPTAAASATVSWVLPRTTSMTSSVSVPPTASHSRATSAPRTLTPRAASTRTVSASRTPVPTATMTLSRSIGSSTETGLQSPSLSATFRPTSTPGRTPTPRRSSTSTLTPTLRRSSTRAARPTPSTLTTACVGTRSPGHTLSLPARDGTPTQEHAPKKSTALPTATRTMSWSLTPTIVRPSTQTIARPTRSEGMTSTRTDLSTPTAGISASGSSGDVRAPEPNSTLIPAATVAPVAVPVRRSLSAVFDALISSACGPRYATFLAVSIGTAALPAVCAVLIAAARRYGVSFGEARERGRSPYRSLGGSGESQPEGLTLPRALAALHGWAGLVLPCHLRCAPDHAVQWSARVGISLFVLTAVSSMNVAFTVRDSWTPAVIIGAFAATVATALQPLLALPQWKYSLEIVSLRGLARRRARSAQDLVAFGVKQQPYVGVSTDIFAKLDGIDFEGPQSCGLGACDGPEIRIVSCDSDDDQPCGAFDIDRSLPDNTGFLHVPRDQSRCCKRCDGIEPCDDRVIHVAPLRANHRADVWDRSSAEKTPPGAETPKHPGAEKSTMESSAIRTGAVQESSDSAPSISSKQRGMADSCQPTSVSLVRRGWWCPVGRSIAVLCAALGLLLSSYISAPFCSAGDSWRFDSVWRCAVAAAATDALILQPLFAALCVLREWYVSDPDGGRRSSAPPQSCRAVSTPQRARVDRSSSDTDGEACTASRNTTTRLSTSIGSTDRSNDPGSSTPSPSLWSVFTTKGVYPAHPVNGAVAALHFQQ